MLQREKLIELIMASVGGCARHWAEVIADHLIAHGVTVQEDAEWIVPTIIGGRAFDIPHCSACDGVPAGVDEHTKYCPHCGAKMDEEKDEVKERLLKWCECATSREPTEHSTFSDKEEKA